MYENFKIAPKIQFFNLFQARYAHNPLDLYHVIRQCLLQEMDLLQRPDIVCIENFNHILSHTHFLPSCNIFIQMENNSPSSSAGEVVQCNSENAYEIVQQLSSLKRNTKECGLDVEKVSQLQESHNLNVYNHQKITGSKINKISFEVRYME